MLNHFKRKIHRNHHSNPNVGWRPAYLQRRTLFGFLVLFCGGIVVLEILYHVSQANHGIASSTASRHYAWTYGPTAVVTLITALWTRVEFQAKQNAPWQAMQEKPTEASQSLLLDYISVLLPVALFKALKNRHLIVAATITCTLLLRLVIIVSTGLFALQEIPVRKDNIEVRLDSTFSGDDVDFISGNSNPFDIVNSVLFKNGTYPDGTTQDLVFQMFSAPNIPSNAILTVPVTGMAARLECEPASLTVNEWEIRTIERERHDAGSVNITSPSCNLANMGFDMVNNDVRYEAFYRSQHCEGTSGPEGMRIVVVALDLELTQNPSSSDEWDFEGTVSVRRSAQLICKPTYSLFDLHATWNASEPFSTVRLDRLQSNNSTLPSVSGVDIAAAFPRNMEDSAVGVATDKFPFHDPDASEDSDPLSDVIPVPLQLGAWIAEETGNVAILLNETLLERITTSYYRTIAAQIINKGLVRKQSSNVFASAIFNENRVVMTEVPLRVMEISLVVGILLALAVIIQRSRKVVFTAPREPHSIFGIAAIVSRSSALVQSLSGTSAASLSTLHRRLDHGYYDSQHHDKEHFIKVVNHGKEDNASVHEPLVADGESEEEKPATPKPFPSLPFRIAIFLAVVAVIIALEVLLHNSQKNDGLGDVSKNEYIHYLWTLLPALLMFAIRLSFGSVDGNTRLLAPYAYLRRPTGATFDQSMSIDFQNALDITVILKSVRTGHFAVLATTLATLATSFLTIITSGLFSPLEIPRYTTAEFLREDTFNRLATYKQLYVEGDTPAMLTDIESIATAEYILQNNLTYPRWTYEELAFPKLGLTDTAKHAASNHSFVDLWVPALRDAPVCHLLTGSELNATIRKPYPYDYDAAGYIVEVHFPQFSCTPYSGNQTWMYFDMQSLQLNDSGIFTRVSPSECSNGHDTSVSYWTGFYWGSFENATISHIAALLCVSSAETVNTLTRFQLPDFDIPEDHPPVPDESAVTRYPDLPVPYTELQGFFQALTTGRYAIPWESFGDPSETDKVVDAIKFHSNIYRAQEFNGFSRAEDTSGHVLYPGKVLSGTQLRLVQDPVSTRILEGLLALILIFGVIGSILINTDHVLPKSPSSIAAVASLLADSNILAWVESAGEGKANEDSVWRKTFDQHRFFIGRCVDSSETDRPLQERPEKSDEFTINVAGSAKD
ncbi:hypothetical protein FE257_006670 [Aspergillus nanangensis]|uniref:Uncharacterized protein n=1 Tax=Aspergillus nanangensis TaxID=2582783 RepID=A0AAD4GUT4_ASPNN|nr:hypothetical protein FE257_006670 [Aspergillus nanangensis]